MTNFNSYFHKNKYFAIFLVFVLALGIFAWALWLIATNTYQPETGIDMAATSQQLSKNAVVLTDQDIAELNDFDSAINGDDKLEYKVSSNTDGPQIQRVIIAPEKVSRGETQYLEVWVKDELGVSEVYTDTELDDGHQKHLDMELSEGDEKDGKWRASWIVDNTHDTTYTTTFTAINSEDKDTIVRYGWLDPCSPPFRGKWDIITQGISNCNMGGYVGTDDGNIKVGINNDTPVNLIIENNTTLVFTPGRSITIEEGGSISLGPPGNSGEIKEGYIFVLDEDSDSVAKGSDHIDTSKRIFSDSPGSSYTVPSSTTSILRMQDEESRQYYTRLGDLGEINGFAYAGGDCASNPSQVESTLVYAGQNKYFHNKFFRDDNGSNSADFNCDGDIRISFGPDINPAGYLGSQLDNELSFVEQITGICTIYAAEPPPNNLVQCTYTNSSPNECLIAKADHKSLAFDMLETVYNIFVSPALADEPIDHGFYKDNRCSSFPLDNCFGQRIYNYCN